MFLVLVSSLSLLFLIQGSDGKGAPLPTEARVLWETSQLAFEILFPGSGRAFQKVLWPTHDQTASTGGVTASPSLLQDTCGWASEFWTLAGKK